MKKTERLKNQLGLTLIELLLAVAIFSIVMLAMFSFMTAITKQYTKANNEVSVQNEVQTLMAHLQDLVVSTDTNIGVSGTKIILVDDDRFEVIQYDQDNEYLYYYSSDQLNLSKDEKDAYASDSLDREGKFDKAVELINSHSITDTGAMVESYLMTEYVSSFVIDPHISDNYIALYVTISKNNTSYTGSKNIYLRNAMYDSNNYGVSSDSTKKNSTTAASDETTASASGGSGSGSGSDSTPETQATTEATIQKATEAESSASDKVTITSVKVNYYGGKVYYGDTMSASNFGVEVHYSDGSSQYNVTGWTAKKGFLANDYKDDNSFVAIYEGVESSNACNIPYNDLVGISVSYNDTGAKYAGDKLSSDNFIVYNVYSDGSTKLATYGDEWSCDDLNNTLVKGTNTFTVYSSLNTSLKNAALVLENIETTKTVNIEYVSNGSNGKYDGFVINDEYGWQSNTSSRTVSVPESGSLLITGCKNKNSVDTKSFSYADLQENGYVIVTSFMIYSADTEKKNSLIKSINITYDNANIVKYGENGEQDFGYVYTVYGVTSGTISSDSTVSLDSNGSITVVLKSNWNNTKATATYAYADLADGDTIKISGGTITKVSK